MRDILDWLSELIIPTFVGLASLVVAIAAVRTSRDAMKLAQDAESSRRRDEEQVRLTSEANDQAKLLVEWVHEVLKRRPYVFSRPINAPPEPSETDRLEREARATMAVSGVAGATYVFAITEHDLRSETKQWPRESDAQAMYRDLWEARVVERIRTWAVDPKGAVDSLREEIRFAEQHPIEHGRIELGLGWEHAYDNEDEDEE